MNKLVHHITVIYLMAVILLRMMAMPVSLINCSLNRQFIAKNLCENRFNTAVHCGGTCYIKKQLARSQDSGTQDTKGTAKVTVVDYFEQHQQVLFQCVPLVTGSLTTLHQTSYSHLFSRLILRPPIS